MRSLLYDHFFVLFGTMEGLELSEDMMVCLDHVCLACEKQIKYCSKSRRP